MEHFAVGGADTQCLCGEPAGVFANASIDPSGKNWVLQLGSMSIALDVCIDGVHCALSCGSPGPPPPPPTGGLQLGAGIQSQDPNENPTFATFNQAELSLCDGALLMSDRAHYRTPSNASLPAPGYPFPVRPSLHFNGLRILNASLLKLAKLGLAKAPAGPGLTRRPVLQHPGTVQFLRRLSQHFATLRLQEGRSWRKQYTGLKEFFMEQSVPPVAEYVAPLAVGSVSRTSCAHSCMLAASPTEVSVPPTPSPCWKSQTSS